MSNITLSVDDEVIRKVRKVAIDKNTTLTQLVRDFLESECARSDTAKEQALGELEESFASLSRDMGGRRWTRDELHER